MSHCPHLRLCPLSSWSLSVALALAGIGPLVQAQEGVHGPRTGAWAHESSALKPDPAVTWGRLDNGLRYALLPHSGVTGRVSFRFMILTGSLDETESERGIAHFIEHLAFRSTRHFTSGQQVEFFQQLGMDPNSDINARTGHSETVYMIECRESNDDLLRKALLWIRDVADGVTFVPEEFDQERGVILSELRVRDGLMARSMDAASPVLFKGLRFSERSPGGTPAHIRGFKREDFLGFYERNYRSDQMIIVAAGDFGADALAAMIQERFGDLSRPTTPVPARDEGRLDTTKGLRAGVFKVTDVGSAAAHVGFAIPAATKPDSREERINALRRRFAMDVFAQRMRKETGGSASYELGPGFEAAIASGPIDPEDWARSLGVVDDLVRFTYQKGFEAREIEPIKRRYLTAAQFMLDQKRTLDPALLAERVTEAIENHRVYLGYEQEEALERDWVRQVTAKEINLAFQSSWDLERMAFHLSGDVDIEGGPSAIVKKVQEARRAGLRYFRPDTRKEAVFKLPTWGTPTAVAESKEITELGATLMRFGNNVRLNFVPNPGEPGVVHILARFGTGLLEMPEDRPALKEYGLQTLLSGGSAHYTSEQLGELIQDHVYNIGLDLEENDAFAFRASAASEKIDVPLAIITDFLFRPIFGSLTHREEKFKAFLTGMVNGGGMSDGERQLQNHLFRGDSRFTSATDAKDVLRLSTVDVKDWLLPPLTRGYLEVTIVGDISQETVVKAVGRTLGSLPPRAASKVLTFPPKPIKMTAEPGFRRIEFVGEQHIGQVAGVWPIQEGITVRDHGTLLVLVKILEQHIYREVRARLGLAYSPTAALQRFSGFQNFALMRARIECDPADTTRVAALLEEIAAHLAEGGITPGEFIGARGVLSGQLRSSLTDGNFLITMVRRAQENPASLDQAIQLRHGLIDEITFDEVDAWARKIFPRKNSRTAAIVPKQFIGIFQTGGP